LLAACKTLASKAKPWFVCLARRDKQISVHTNSGKRSPDPCAALGDAFRLRVQAVRLFAPALQASKCSDPTATPSMRRAIATVLMLGAARALQRCAPRVQRRTLARRRRVKANAEVEAKEPGVESYNTLKKLAADFMQRRNKGDIAGIVKDLAPKAEIYGLTGDKIKPGLEDFFKERPNLQHEMVEEPWQLGDATIEYRFEKTWDGGSWNSYDIEEQRDKVERLVFEGGKLKRVSVEEVGRGGEDVLEDDFAASLLRKPGDNPDDPPEPKPSSKKSSKKK
jgi:hypothetical protein